MCRMAALVASAAAPLSTLLADPPHSLTEQAYRPRLQSQGFVNVDGTGVVWWPEAGDEPLRYATDRPPWSDANLLRLAPRLRGTVQLAAVRSASPGLPFGPGATAPFLVEGVAVAHNGRVEGIRGPLGRALLDRLPDDLYAHAEVLTDSVLLTLTLVDALRTRPAAGLAGAVAATVLEVERRCAAAGVPGGLTMLAGDGRRVVGVRAAVGVPPATLFTTRAWGLPGAVLAASEPLDDDLGWTEVPDRHLVELTLGTVQLAPLDLLSDLETTP
jgi:gamma-glutamyl hercynylcysteine S-oxide hydrolase